MIDYILKADNQEGKHDFTALTQKKAKAKVVGYSYAVAISAR
jgi:hypothetical protein